MDITSYKIYFTKLNKKEKKEFLLDVLGKVQKKSTVFEKLVSIIKDNTNIPTIFLDEIFDKLNQIILYISQNKKTKSLQALQDIHNKILELNKKEQQEKKQEDVETILHQLS